MERRRELVPGFGAAAGAHWDMTSNVRPAWTWTHGWVEPRPGGTQNINKATHEGTGRPRGELEPWQKSELCGCSCSQTPGKGKTMRGRESEREHGMPSRVHSGPLKL